MRKVNVCIIAVLVTTFCSCLPSARRGDVPLGWTEFSLPCGTKRAMYKNTSAATERLTFRIALKSSCRATNVRVLCAGVMVTPVALSAGETHDVVCQLDPNQILDIDCPGADGSCVLHWTLLVTSTSGVTERRCGIDNDVVANGTATPEPIEYRVCNDGDCPWDPTCNGGRLVDTNTGALFTLLPRRCVRINCTLDPDNVLAGVCHTNGGGDCILRFRRLR